MKQRVLYLLALAAAVAPPVWLQATMPTGVTQFVERMLPVVGEGREGEPASVARVGERVGVVPRADRSTASKRAAELARRSAARPDRPRRRAGGSRARGATPGVARARPPTPAPPRGGSQPPPSPPPQPPTAGGDEGQQPPGPGDDERDDDGDRHGPSEASSGSSGPGSSNSGSGSGSGSSGSGSSGSGGEDAGEDEHDRDHEDAEEDDG